MTDDQMTSTEAKLCAYVDGELDPQACAEIERHLASNPQHRQLMIELREQRALLRGLPRTKAPEDLLEAVQAQLERSVLLDPAGGGAGPGPGPGAAAGEMSGAVAGRITRWPQMLSAAAVLFMVVGLAAVMLYVLAPMQKARRAAVATSARPASGPAALLSEAPPAAAIGSATQPSADLSVAMRDKDAAAGATTSDSLGMPSLRKDAAKDASVALERPGPLAAAAPPMATVAPATPATPPTLPAPALAPAAMPPASSVNDVFAKGGGAFNGGAAIQQKGVGDAYKNVFASSGVEQQLRNSSLPDNSLWMVVSSDNPSAANRQVQAYLESNKIHWDEGTEPPPTPIAQGEILRGSRLNNLQMKLKSAGNYDAEKLTETQSKSPAAADLLKKQELLQQKQIAPQEAAGANTSPSFKEADVPPPAKEQPAPTAEAAAEPPQASPPPSARQADIGAAPGAVAAAPSARNVSREPTRASKSAAAGKQAPEDIGNVTNSANASSNSADENAAASKVAQAPQIRAGQVRQDIAPESHQQQQNQEQPPALNDVAAGTRDAAVAQQQEQQQRARTETGSGDRSFTLGPPQQQAQASSQGQSQTQQSQPSQPSQQPATQPAQLIVARGLTPDQVLALCNTLSAQNGGRVTNYLRNGESLAPATLPAGVADNYNNSAFSFTGGVGGGGAGLQQQQQPAKQQAAGESKKALDGVTSAARQVRNGVAPSGAATDVTSGAAQAAAPATTAPASTPARGDAAPNESLAGSAATTTQPALSRFGGESGVAGGTFGSTTPTALATATPTSQPDSAPPAGPVAQIDGQRQLRQSAQQTPTATTTEGQAAPQQAPAAARQDVVIIVQPDPVDAARLYQAPAPQQIQLNAPPAAATPPNAAGAPSTQP